MSDPDPGAPREIAIVPAAGLEHMALARALFLEYQAWLDVDLCFQGFEAELENLPGGYGPPLGGLWFAQVDGEVAGVVGLRPLEADGVAEMKRLWVRPDYRGLCLDTLPMMAQAHALYASLGFREAAPYYHNPVDGVVYLELDLVAETVDSA